MQYVAQNYQNVTQNLTKDHQKQTQINPNLFKTCHLIVFFNPEHDLCTDDTFN